MLSTDYLHVIARLLHMVCTVTSSHQHRHIHLTLVSHWNWVFRIEVASNVLCLLADMLLDQLLGMIWNKWRLRLAEIITMVAKLFYQAIHFTNYYIHVVIGLSLSENEEDTRFLLKRSDQKH